MLCCFSDVKGHIIPCYVAFSLFPLALRALACFLPVSPCQTIPASFASYAAIVFPRVPPRQALPFSLTVSPCRSLPVPREKSPLSGLKIAQMGTKIAYFAVYRSEIRPKNPVNRQTQKDSHKIFCTGCTNKSKRLTNFKNQNFYIPQMDFCKFNDAKNANPAKNAGAILALPTGQGDSASP